MTTSVDWCRVESACSAAVAASHVVAVAHAWPSRDWIPDAARVAPIDA
jgi:hypothetical protein